jgi:hypothetical protein
MECWLPLTGRFFGDMRSHEVWDALSGVLGTGWLDREGNLYRPVCAALDIQGDHYPECLEYARAHAHLWLAGSALTRPERKNAISDLTI